MSHPGLAPPDAIDVPSGVYVGLDLDTLFDSGQGASTDLTMRRRA